MKKYLTAYILLGSNLENPLEQVATAVAEIACITHAQLAKQSQYYSSKPHGPQDQPDYVNKVIALETSLTAHELLFELQAIEKKHGRIRVTHRFGPRTLDLDILLYGDKIINTPNLIVPHPRLPERNFVLYPLAEIAPDLILPGGESLQSLVEQCSKAGLTVLHPLKG